MGVSGREQQSGQGEGVCVYLWGGKGTGIPGGGSRSAESRGENAKGVPCGQKHPAPKGSRDMKEAP